MQGRKGGGRPRHGWQGIARIAGMCSIQENGRAPRYTQKCRRTGGHIGKGTKDRWGMQVWLAAQRAR